MKYFKYIFVVVVIIVIGLLIKKYPLKDQVATNPSDAKDVCYIWNTEAGDSATLHMAISGIEVNGSFNYLPAEKDSKTGTIAGTADMSDEGVPTRTANLIWTASGEGVTNKEELIINFTDSVAHVGFGEMKQDADGTWVYADPSKVSYDLALQQTDCSDPAVK